MTRSGMPDAPSPRGRRGHGLQIAREHRGRPALPGALRALAVGVIVAALAACAGDSGVDRLACPVLGAGTPSLVKPITALPFDAAQKGTFEGGWFIGYAFVPPPNVTVKITLAGALPDASVLLMIYGPRTPYGDWGVCQRVSDAASDGSTSLSVSVEGGISSELLLVVANQNPLAATGTSFQVTLSCEGACAVEPACPEPLAATCAISYCPAGFASGDDGCPICACEGGASSCPPGFLVLAGTCVDPCAINVTGDPVCGSDGKTYASVQAAKCAGVPDTHPGSCEDSCGASSCDKVCDAYAIDPQTYCPLCECQDAGDCSDCPKMWSPVCGSDDVTYVNACYAACGGVTRGYPGECLSGCVMPTKTCASAEDFGYDPESLCPTCSFAPTVAQAFSAGTTACALLCAVESEKGLCLSRVYRAFPSEATAKKVPSINVSNRPCTLLDCTKDADCDPPGKASPGQSYDCHDVKGADKGYCTHTVLCTPSGDQCTAGRTCEAIQGVQICLSKCSCPYLYDPVCALHEGKARIFDSACDANCAGARVVQPGRCCKALEVSCKEGEVPALDSVGCRTGSCVAPVTCDDVCRADPFCVNLLDSATPATNACMAHCDGGQVDPAMPECKP